MTRNDLFKITNENPAQLHEALDLVIQELKIGNPLNFTHLGFIFGQPFWELICLYNIPFTVPEGYNAQITFYKKDDGDEK